MRTYGIRHHGPGSASRLLAALEAWRPDLVLLEMPADAGATLRQLINPDLRPPVALTIYDAKNIERASFYPFAEFSPEYRALVWADARGVEVRPIDLPARHDLAEQSGATPPTLFATQAPPPETPSVIPGKTRAELSRLVRRDPLAVLAKLAGYPDGESWWDATLERGREGPEATFAALRELVADLRQTFPEAASDELLRREAYMRGEMRKAMKADFHRIAVVVGAFHLPAVTNIHHFKVSADKALLRGLPKVKTAAAWVPWSYPRLARSSGYGAGVDSPAWYELLYRRPDQAVDYWMALAARLLRDEGFDAGPAMATEAVGLARTLATLREQEQPGIVELEEAVLGTLAAGRPERLALIHERLTVGTTVGFVPPGVTSVPLAEDLYRELKSTRMAKLWEVTGQHYLKATKTNPRGGIDLRASNDLRKSLLIHRLNLLGVRWGTPQPTGPDSLSSFKEIWLLEWQPEFSLLLIERASYGNTVGAAAENFARERAADLTTVLHLTELTLDCLRAALPQVVEELMDRLRDRAAATEDAGSLLAALPALVRTSRYGDSRKTDTTALLLVIDELLPRLAAGLPGALHNLDEERARAMLDHIAAANNALAQLDNEMHTTTWVGGLARAAQGGGHPLPTGLCVRLLYDHGKLTDEETAIAFSRALSGSGDARGVADWLGGFLYGSGQLLFHYPPLWNLVNGWVDGLVWADFERVLPLLRRTFADFSAFDRRRLFRLASREGRGEDETTTVEWQTQAETAGEEVEEDLIEALLEWMA